MRDAKDRRGRHRPARRLHQVAAGAGQAATFIDVTAEQLDHVTDVLRHLDRRTFDRVWRTAQHPRRSSRRAVAAFALGALSALAATRLWRHLRTGSGAERPTNADWHVDRVDDRWDVLDPSADGPRSTHRTQAEAVEAAERSLAAMGGGRLVIHALDGRPREVHHVAGSGIR